MRRFMLFLASSCLILMSVAWVEGQQGGGKKGGGFGGIFGGAQQNPLILLNRAEVKQNHTQLYSMAKLLSEQTVGALGTEISGSPSALAFDAVFSGSILPSLAC